MGDGDEGMKTSPRLFFMLRTPSGRHAACPLPALSLSLGRRRFSPLCLSSVGAWVGAWFSVLSCGAVGLSARRSFHRVDRRGDGSTCRLVACLCSCLVAQCGRRVACPAVVVPVKRHGGGAWSLVVHCLLG